MAGSLAIEEVLASTAISTTSRVAVDGRQAVLRVDGPGAARLGLDRAAEVQVLAAVAAEGLGPACLASDPAAGTLLTEWLPGRALTGADLQDPANLGRAAHLLRRVHGIAVPGPVLALPAAVERYARAAGSDSRALAAATRAALAACLGGEAGPLRLCHNDPTPGNFIAGVDGQLRLIDWEYAGLGYPAFDLAGLAAGAALDRSGDEVLLGAYLGRAPTALEFDRHGRWRDLVARLADLWGRAVLVGNQ